MCCQSPEQLHLVTPKIYMDLFYPKKKEKKMNSYMCIGYRRSKHTNNMIPLL